MVFVNKPIFDIQRSYSDTMAGKAKTEIACSLSWFRHWDGHQREEFAKLLIDKDQSRSSVTDESIENLLGTMNQMSLGTKEGPSVFECQLTIFSKWYHCWNPSDRTEFVIQLNSISPEFVAFVNNHSLTTTR